MMPGTQSETLQQKFERGKRLYNAFPDFTGDKKKQGFAIIQECANADYGEANAWLGFWRFDKASTTSHTREALIYFQRALFLGVSGETEYRILGQIQGVANLKNYKFTYSNLELSLEAQLLLTEYHFHKTGTWLDWKDYLTKIQSWEKNYQVDIHVDVHKDQYSRNQYLKIAEFYQHLKILYKDAPLSADDIKPLVDFIKAQKDIRLGEYCNEHGGLVFTDLIANMVCTDKVVRANRMAVFKQLVDQGKSFDGVDAYIGDGYLLTQNYPQALFWLQKAITRDDVPSTSKKYIPKLIQLLKEGPVQKDPYALVEAVVAQYDHCDKQEGYYALVALAEQKGDDNITVETRFYAQLALLQIHQSSRTARFPIFFAYLMIDNPKFYEEGAEKYKRLLLQQTRPDLKAMFAGYCAFYGWNGVKIDFEKAKQYFIAAQTECVRLELPFGGIQLKIADCEEKLALAHLSQYSFYRESQIKLLASLHEESSIPPRKAGDPNVVYDRSPSAVLLSHRALKKLRQIGLEENHRNWELLQSKLKECEQRAVDNIKLFGEPASVSVASLVQKQEHKQEDHTPIQEYKQEERASTAIKTDNISMVITESDENKIKLELAAFCRDMKRRLTTGDENNSQEVFRLLQDIFGKYKDYINREDTLYADFNFLLVDAFIATVGAHGAQEPDAHTLALAFQSYEKIYDVLLQKNNLLPFVNANKKLIFLHQKCSNLSEIDVAPIEGLWLRFIDALSTIDINELSVENCATLKDLYSYCSGRVNVDLQKSLDDLQSRLPVQMDVQMPASVVVMQSKHVEPSHSNHVEPSHSNVEEQKEPAKMPSAKVSPAVTVTGTISVSERQLRVFPMLKDRVPVVHTTPQIHVSSSSLSTTISASSNDSTQSIGSSNTADLLDLMRGVSSSSINSADEIIPRPVVALAAASLGSTINPGTKTRGQEVADQIAARAEKAKDSETTELGSGRIVKR